MVSFRSLVAYELNHDIIVSKFELKTRYYVHFWTNFPGKVTNPLILTVSLLLFYKHSFGIK